MSEERRLRDELARKGYTSYEVIPIASGETRETAYLVNIEDEDGLNRRQLSGSFDEVLRGVRALPDAR